MERYDVVVIGGGIHGVGVAQAASAAGYSVLLLEKTGIASATSSCSSKLIHGGLRYLESAQFSLVYECLHERHLLTRIAPDLVKLEAFYLPVYKSTSRSRLVLRSGLSLYALLGGLRASTRFKALRKKHWGALDGLKQEGLKAVYQYFDGRTDDAALTRAVMHSASALGAHLEMPAEFVSAECDAANVNIVYQAGDLEKHCTACALVNATGAWVNQSLEKISPGKPALKIDLVQGAHLVLNGIPVKHCFYLEAPQDRRAVFILPWKDKTLIGTTETSFTGRVEDVAPQVREKTYLLDVAGHYFPDAGKIDISDAFAGLRVLPAVDRDYFNRDHFNKARETVLLRSHARVINIYGGKLTTYRLVANRVMAKLRDVLPERKIQALTDSIMLKPG